MTLIEKLETAEAGSRQLSCEFLVALGWAKDGAWTFTNPTTNLQDAVDLVPEVMLGMKVGYDRPSRTAYAAILRPFTDDHSGKTFYAKAATPALALCVAILRANEVK